MSGNNDLIFEEILATISQGLSRDQAIALRDGLNALDREQFLSAYASVQFAAPEARVDPTRYLYETYLKGPMIFAGLDDGQKVLAVNRVAGEQVVSVRKSER